MTQKESEKAGWDQTRTPPTTGGNIAAVASQYRALPKLLVFLILFVSATYVVYTLKLVSSSSSTSRGCDVDEPMFSSTHNRLSLGSQSPNNTTDELAATESPEIQKRTTAKIPPVAAAVEAPETHPRKTELKDIAFGIAASAKLWEHRKNYIKLWWKPKEMRGVVWLDSPVKTRPGEGLPELRVSGDTSQFKYTNRQGLQLAIRISRIVSETFRVGMKDVRWFVMGDDDTVFVTDNLIRVLSKYDHNQYYYVGGQSESHLQNIYFSYSMAFGGGGFAISYPLAKALEKMQDRCLQRYPGLFASDDRIQACMAELGVPLTREPGFHQYDVFGNLLGLLGAHPVAPLVSLHHLDVVEPIFPNMTRVEALQRLKIPMKLDSAALIQQSICYDSDKKWTVSVSWGFVIQVFRGVLSPREIEMPSRTFLNWYKRADFTAYSFNTRPVSRNPCQKPFVFYLSRARLNTAKNQTVSEYSRHRVPHPDCRWKMPDPADIEKVMVFKKPDPHLWERAPRRNCCRVVKTRRRRHMVVDVGMCREGEVSETHS